MDYLNEAKKILEKLDPLEAYKFLNDEIFLQGLSEEIGKVANSKVPLNAIFEITDSGLVFREISEAKTGVLTISIPLDFLNKKLSENKLIAETTEASKLSKDYLELDLALKKRDLLDKLLKEK